MVPKLFILMMVFYTFKVIIVAHLKITGGCTPINLFWVFLFPVQHIFPLAPYIPVYCIYSLLLLNVLVWKLRIFLAVMYTIGCFTIVYSQVFRVTPLAQHILGCNTSVFLVVSKLYMPICCRVIVMPITPVRIRFMANSCLPGGCITIYI